MLFSPNGGCVEIERNLLQSVFSPDIHIAQQIACARVISDSRICNDFPCIGGNFLKGRIIRANLFKVYCPLIRTFSLIGYFFNFHNIPGIRNYCIITICYDDKLIIKIGDLEQSPKQSNIIIKQIIYNAVGFIYNFLENENRNRKELPLWMSNYFNTSALPENIGKKINELYQIAHYSQPMLSVYFKKYLNTTLVAYMRQLRLDYDTKLLIHSNYPISLIANKISYTPGHFIHEFSSKYSLSPAECRNKLNKNR